MLAFIGVGLVAGETHDMPRLDDAKPRAGIAGS